LEVNIPIYNQKVCTNDQFIINSDGFYHNGRADLIRINDHVVDVNGYNEILKVFKPIIDSKFVYDPAVNEIYLAIWKTSIVGNSDETGKSNLDILIRIINNNIGNVCWVHHISKYEILDPKLFFTGVKIDDQLLRDYFRSHVEVKSNPSTFILEHKEQYLKKFEGLDLDP